VLFALTNHLPFVIDEGGDLVAFQKGQRKDEVTQKYPRGFTSNGGTATCRAALQPRAHEETFAPISDRRYRLDLNHEVRTVELRYFDQRHRGGRRRSGRCEEAIARLPIGPQIIHVPVKDG